MIPLKEKPQYVNLDPNFTPLPKYGHLSEKTPEFLAVEPHIAAAYDKFWLGCPDFPTFRREAEVEAEAAAGSPDPYRREVQTELLHFPARDGHLVELKVYKSPKVSAEATLVYRMHGGGFCVGNHETDGAENVHAATNPDIVVVSVDYRLAPEHPFPKGLEDSYDGLIWCQQNAKTLGINPSKIILAGSSAGANLAAVLTLLTHKNSIPGILAQILHFPTVCHPQAFPSARYEFGSYVQNAENCVLSTLRYEAFLDAYLPVPPGSGSCSSRDMRLSPLLADSDSLANLPPALIQCAGVDIFRDEAFAYAIALTEADNTVEIYGYGGVPHCFPAVIPSHPSTPLFYERYNAFLKKYASSSSTNSA
ncbi:alpha/beta-hydrolase [Poronia punctata]|nr:alpha/beta-hydrolase [Poronia punctata]